MKTTTVVALATMLGIGYLIFKQAPSQAPRPRYVSVRPIWHPPIIRHPTPRRPIFWHPPIIRHPTPRRPIWRLFGR